VQVPSAYIGYMDTQVVACYALALFSNSLGNTTMAISSVRCTQHNYSRQPQNSSAGITVTLKPTFLAATSWTKAEMQPGRAWQCTILVSAHTFVDMLRDKATIVYTMAIASSHANSRARDAQRQT
jgi:hypothetical protein